MVRRNYQIIVMILLAMACGRGMDRVEPMKGPPGSPGADGKPGVNGSPGDNGRDGKDGRDAQAPKVDGTGNGWNTIIILNGPNYPQCPSKECPPPLEVVCAKYNGKATTIMIPASEEYMYEILNHGPCSFGNPVPVPTPAPNPPPAPIPKKDCSCTCKCTILADVALCFNPFPQPIPTSQPQTCSCTCNTKCEV